MPEFLVRNRAQIITLMLEHMWMVGVAMALAIAIGVPLGILVSRKVALRKLVLGVTSIVQTIPSLALFGFLLPLPLLGAHAQWLAVTALTLYALLPIVRNTFAGISSVDRPVREAAEAMGLTSRQLLTMVELPLAAPFIIAGVRIATVTAIGVATIAAAIGAGGLGEFVFRGVAMVDNGLVLAGAIPAALLAITADAALGFAERRWRTPRGPH
jgi:osmoprotectant transport system permease protein